MERKREGSEIVNCHPVSFGTYGEPGQVIYDRKLLSDLDPEDQQMVINWIKRNLRPRKTELQSRSSYGIKHIIQEDTNIYMTNNQFNDAMLQCGYYPVNESELNWKYCLSKKSPAFRLHFPFELRKQMERFFIKSMGDYDFCLDNWEKDVLSLPVAIAFNVSTEKTACEFFRKFYSGGNWPVTNGTDVYMHLYRYSRAKGDNLPDLF